MNHASCLLAFEYTCKPWSGMLLPSLVNPLLDSCAASLWGNFREIWRKNHSKKGLPLYSFSLAFAKKTFILELKGTQAQSDFCNRVTSHHPSFFSAHLPTQQQGALFRPPFLVFFFTYLELLGIFVIPLWKWWTVLMFCNFFFSNSVFAVFGHFS